MILFSWLGSVGSWSAPRVCGDDPTFFALPPFRPVVLPAYAGMILNARVQDTRLTRAPRVCGDDPVVEQIDQKIAECSPRMRG